MVSRFGFVMPDDGCAGFQWNTNAHSVVENCFCCLQFLFSVLAAPQPLTRTVEKTQKMFVRTRNNNDVVTHTGLAVKDTAHRTADI